VAVTVVVPAGGGGCVAVGGGELAAGSVPGGSVPGVTPAGVVAGGAVVCGAAERGDVVAGGVVSVDARAAGEVGTVAGLACALVRPEFDVSVVVSA
jgi:hypothetical protein